MLPATELDRETVAPCRRQGREPVDGEPALLEGADHLAPDRAGGPDHRDPHDASRPKRSWTARSARSASPFRITYEIRIGDVEIISMLMPSPASTSNMSAATPGWDFIPAPTSETFAMASSTLNPSAPMSRASAPSTDRRRGRSASGAVNDMSVVPS